MSRGTSRARRAPPALPARQGLPARRGIPGSGISSVDALAGTACKTFDGANGHVEVGSTATDLITLTCETGGSTPPPPRATPGS